MTDITWPAEKLAPVPDWDSIAEEVLSLAQCAQLARCSIKLIRAEVLKKRLPAFIPGDRDPKHTGRGLGYRVMKKDLQRWFFGTRVK